MQFYPLKKDLYDSVPVVPVAGEKQQGRSWHWGWGGHVPPDFY